MKRLMPVVLIIMMLLSVYMLVNERVETKKKYDDYIAEARDLGSVGIVIRSANAYDNALLLKDNFDIALEKGLMYYNNGHMASAVNYAEELVDKYPKATEGYELLLKMYLEEEDYQEFFKVIKEINKRKLSSDAINEMVASVRYIYELGYSEFEEVQSESGNAWGAMKKDYWGYLGSQGKQAIDFKFKTVRPFVSSRAAVQEPDDLWYYIDEAGNKTDVPRIEGNVTDLGAYTELIAIAVDGKYGYYSQKYEHKFGEYDFATTLNNDRAFVKVNDKWQLINNKGEVVSSTEYTDIAMDEKNVAFRNERAFACIDAQYYMLDSSGNKVTETSFTDAKTFLSKEPAAVMLNGKWGFVDTEGNIVIEPKYDDALSFVNGFAAVCEGGRWGYINLNGEQCIDFQFADAKNFSSSGVSLVKEGDSWVSLKLFNITY